MLFDKKIRLLKLSQQPDGSLEWETVRTIPAHFAQQTKANLFSKIGIGAQSAKFTLRKTGITLHDALMYGQQFYFLTQIEENGILLELTAAAVSPFEWTAFRMQEQEGEHRASVQDWIPFLSFPGILTEKYMKSRQAEPMTQQESCFVLVTPKQVLLKPGDRVKLDEQAYTVRVCHLLDAYKNEYEIDQTIDQ